MVPELLHLLSGPVVGAAIGYITNDIAIRMLFRPHKAVYVLGHRLPFTPGIVPRRKDQLARILGDAIVEKFFNADDLEVIFTDGIADAVADRVTEALRSDADLSFLQDEVPPEGLERLESELCVRIQAAICTSGLPELFAREGGRLAASRLSGAPAGQALAAGVTEAVAAPLAHEIEEFVINEGHAFLLPLVKREVERLFHQPVSGLTALLAGEEGDDRLRAAIRSLYLRFMRRHVRPIVESIDVGGMITEKIVQMDSAQVEDLVLSVVRRELRLVVLFGAFVGAVIGAVNILL